MKKIKTLFRSLSLSSDYDKILLKIHSSDDYLRPTEDTILKIKDALEGRESDITQQKAIQEFFQQAKEYDHWNQAMKTLYIMHKLIHMMKLNVTFMITENDLASNFKANLKINGQSDEIHVPIVLKYYNFQKQIAKNFTQFYECEQYFSSENLEYLKLKKIQEIVSTLTPLISILKNIFKVTQNLSFSLSHFQKFEITKYVGFMIIKDSIMIYDFLSAVMNLIKERILTEEQSVSLSLYEAYEEVVVLTKNIEKLYDLRNFTIDPYIKKPRYFKIEKESNKRIELHINDIHKRMNNTDNVVATVTKSVNESTIQQNQFHANSIHSSPNCNNQHQKYADENIYQKQNCNKHLNKEYSPIIGSYSHRVIHTELQNLNCRNVGDDEDYERINQQSPDKISSGNILNEGSQLMQNNDNPELQDDQNKEDDQELNFNDNQSSDNQRIYINTLCTKNDKIQPAVKREKRSSVNTDNRLKKTNEEQIRNPNGLKRDLTQSNSIINLMFESSKRNSDLEDEFNHHKQQSPAKI